jgi:type I restriction enzyme R subunit
MIHNEDSRVKVPALLHFLRLGYTYQSKRSAAIDCRNNIFVDVFKDSIRRINNKDYDDTFLEDVIKEISELTNNNKDKGEHFFNRLLSYQTPTLIDLENPTNNDFRVVTELTFLNDQQEFRPDITILINGIPLAFIEVKKPNNQGGIQSEFSRMGSRMKEPSFRKFFNQFQILGFTNNMEYDDEARVKLQGSFYTTPNFEGTRYNNFREEIAPVVNDYINETIIDEILHDNNIMSIRETSEFGTNLQTDTSANLFITSLFSKDRLIFFIRYGIVYVDSPRDGLQKHIIRYPQYFALQNLVKKIRAGLKRGIIWHTQGSGKTGLSYFATNVLRDYFQEKNVITKFYFVVDRLDLLVQASDEFNSRGMTIATINSKKDFVENIKSPVIVPPNARDGRYKETMNVVNIQKFSEYSTVDLKGSKDIQRIYFLDEVHRGYKPKGTFLANLLGSDPNGIFVGLTGTPLLKSDFKSTDIFSEYIHKYYYNKSIADGYTLKIKKENISTTFREKIRDVLKIEEGKRIPAKDWETETKKIGFIDELCKYIINDFTNFKENPNVNDPTLGCMIVTSSTVQARGIKEWFDDNSGFKSALVLHDEENNKAKQEGFRGKRNKDTGKLESEYEGVVVYNMLLTGFDAPRLKRLYLLREIKEHSLLQTLARVNRPYRNMKYGYVVDFVDITEQYEETNKRYLEELRADIADDDDTTDVQDIFVDVKLVLEKIKELEGKLFIYMGNIESNLEHFRNQIEYLDEKDLRGIKSHIDEYRECYNELRMSHHDTSNIPIDRLNKAFYEVSNKINIKVAERLINDPDADINDVDVVQLVFEFIKTGEIDLEFASGDDVIERVSKLKNAFSSNNDQSDPDLTKLSDRFKNIIRQFKNEASSTEIVKVIITELNTLYKDIMTLNLNNNSLTNYYRGDDSCMRIHKRLRERYSKDLTDLQVRQIMQDLIKVIDENINLLGVPAASIVIARLKKPIRKAFREQGIPNVSPRMAEDIALLFVEDKFRE